MLEVQLWSLVPRAPGDDDFASVIAITRFPCVVGRQPGCDYRINNPLVSRQHCALSLRNGRVWVEDLQSRNGTRLNGEALQGARPLSDGDLLDLGHLPFGVRLPGSRREPRQVLVVEDDVTVARTLAVLLESWGHHVRVAHDGAQALRAAQEEPPDTVVLDIRLPGMDGYEVARRLRAEAGLKKARLLAITGDETANDPHRTREGGITQFLVKPVNPQALRKALAAPA
jgi:CheY-like chemotaxis protein